MVSRSTLTRRGPRLPTGGGRSAGSRTPLEPSQRSSSAKQIVQVERVGEHLQRAVRLLRPLLLRPVPIKLDAVVVRVAQIERLGDAVVAGAFERDLGGDQPPQRVGQKPAGRVENGGMVKAGGAGGGRRAAAALPGVQADMMVVAAGRDEGRARPAGGHRETQHAAIEIERPLQVGDLEMDVADAHPRVDGGQLEGLFFKRFGG